VIPSPPTLKSILKSQMPSLSIEPLALFFPILPSADITPSVDAVACVIPLLIAPYNYLVELKKLAILLDAAKYTAIYH
jgi:hypothetical protein